MTLAVAILFVSFSITSTDATLGKPQSNPAAGTADTQQTQPNQAAPDTTKPAPSQPPKAPVSKPKPSTAKKAQQRKKVVSETTCDPAPANGSEPGSINSPPPEQPGGAQAPAISDAQKNCPPPKKVVHQGGITEQSIQLAGGSSGGEATQKRESTNQMLTATEENLKKAAAIQLSPAQQSSISQIRQFVDQSKKALKDADFERAHTLAWKAKVLSDDLTSPK
jgi:hypothetical protein